MTYTVTRADLPEQHVAVVRGHVAHDGIGAFLGDAFGTVAQALAAQGTEPSGMPFARYRAADGGWEVVAGFPVDSPIGATGDVVPATLPGGHAARVLHQGPYDAVAGAYEAAERWVVENGLRPSDAPWECYLDGPEVAEPRTEVFLPCVEAHR